jgi:hypothetical protein
MINAINKCRASANSSSQSEMGKNAENQSQTFVNTLITITRWSWLDVDPIGMLQTHKDDVCSSWRGLLVFVFDLAYRKLLVMPCYLVCFSLNWTHDILNTVIHKDEQYLIFVIFVIIFAFLLLTHGYW